MSIIYQWYMIDSMKIHPLTSVELRKWREANHYSQIQLAKELGVTTITVYRWEKGMREIPPFLHLALKYLELKEVQKGKKIGL